MEEFQRRIEELKKTLKIDEKRQKLLDLKEKSKSEEVWKNWEEGNKLSKEISDLEREIEDFDMLYLYLENGDEGLIEKELKEFEFKTYLSESTTIRERFCPYMQGRGTKLWIDIHVTENVP